MLHRDKGEQLAVKVIDALKDVGDVEQRAKVRRKKHNHCFGPKKRAEDNPQAVPWALPMEGR